MKVGVISDIHGNHIALESVIEDMKSQGVSEYIVLGDIFSWGDDPQKCFELIFKLNPKVWIKGNTDDWLDLISDDFIPTNSNEERIFCEYKRIVSIIDEDVCKFIIGLPLTSTFEHGGYSIFCVHGSDRDYNEPIGIMTAQTELKDIFDRMTYDFILCGHTHRQYIASEIGKTILNAGSVGLSVNKPSKEYLILCFDSSTISYEFRRIN